MSQVYNFNAGPAMLPIEVMRQAQEEFLNWNNTGMSLMEISHRSPEFIVVAEQAEQDLRDILKIPNHYHILFLPGGARIQFSTIPMNILGGYQKAAYVHTGLWSGYAIQEAKCYTEIKVIASGESSRFTAIPPFEQWEWCQEAAYLFYVDNETVHGVEFPNVPKCEGVPLVADMSSNLLSRPIDVEQYGLICACAQKNLGMAGLTVVIISDELIKRRPMKTTPGVLNYQKQLEQNSFYNTPPTYPWYISGLIFQWVKKQGGVEALAQRNQRKADKLYHMIDSTDFYQCPVDRSYRSRMNVVFSLPTEELNNLFVKEATKIGLVGLKGHRSAGGIRASIYNAMPEEGVDLLIAFMRDFESRS